MGIGKFRKVISDKTKPNIIDCFIVIALIVVCYFSFNHGDILATSTHGKDLLVCIFKGNFFNFYDFTSSTAVYSIILYLVFAIWSIPVCVVYKLFGLTLWGILDYNGIPYPVLMWYKLLPTLFYIGIAYLLYKIVLELKLDEKIAKWAFFLFISSPIAMFSQFVFGQYDAIGLFFTVLALYMFIKKKYIYFSVFMSFAITFKMFALFVFIPLVLLFEKRVLHIIKHFVIGISLYFLTGLMFINSKGYKDALSFSGDIKDRLFMNGISTQMGTISFFTCVMILLCVFAYVKKCDDDTEFNTYALYISFASFAALFAFILWHPQWVIWVVPFMTLAILLYSNTNISLILQISMFVGYIGVTVKSFVNNVDANMLSLGAFRNIYAQKAPLSLDNLFSRFFGNCSQNLYFSLFAGSLLAMALLYFPAYKKEESVLVTKKYDIGDRLFILARPISICLFVLPSFYYLFR